MGDIFTLFHSDVSERKLIAERIQDVEPILDNNKILREQPQKSDWARHVASIPLVIYEKWFNEYNFGRTIPDMKMFGNNEFGEFVKRKLADPEWKFLRVDK